MKIFVTVGTSKFDDLFIKMDQILLKNHDYIAIGQIGSGKYKPLNFREIFDFKKNIMYYYKWADLVIGHGGAGTLFDILNYNKKSILIPNKELVSDHQIELIGMFHKLGFIIKGDLDLLDNLIKSVNTYNFKLYKPSKNKIDLVITKFLNYSSPNELYK